MLGGPTVQTSRVPRHQRGLPTGMTDAGESLREPCVLKGEGGPPGPTSDFGGGGGAADVAPPSLTPRPCMLVVIQVSLKPFLSGGTGVLREALGS